MKIHNVFYVFLLKLCNQAKEGNAPFLSLIEINGEEKFKVKEIFDSWIQYSKFQYLIKWLGYLDTDNEWILKEQAAGSADLVKLFHKLYPKKPHKGKKKKLDAKRNE